MIYEEVLFRPLSLSSFLYDLPFLPHLNFQIQELANARWEKVDRKQNEELSMNVILEVFGTQGNR